jgi:sulfite exporter TauE/SafE
MVVSTHIKRTLPYLDHCNICITSSSIVSGSIFLASLAGSWHCVAMCGGIATLASRTVSGGIAYHLGRVLCYIALGALAGLIGQTVLFLTIGELTWISQVLMSLMLCGLGLGLLFKEGLHFQFKFLTRLSQVIEGYFRKGGYPYSSAFFLGILTGLLPCGWLYLFIATAAVSGSATNGIVVMSLFWLGTLPYLVLSPVLLHKGLQKASPQLRLWIGLFLIVLGLMRL